MKIAEEQVQIESSGNLQTGTFGIEFDAKMADMLSNKIYSDPILAVVREYICNACDAHKTLAVKRAIDITLPNSLNPTWGVRDYGPGLSQEQIMGTAPEFKGLFNTYGRSNKSGSNDAIGGFGLGSKAGFAYVKKEGAFTVTSYHGGFKKVYTCHRNARGIPAVTLMATTPSKEPTGIHIAVPVSTSDFQSFISATRKVLKYMDIEYTTHGVHDFLVNNDGVPIHFGKDWGYYTNVAQSVLVMGGIGYPVAGIAQGFVIKVPIGSVELSVSREALSYDDSTNAYLANLMDRVTKELCAQVETSVTQAPTLLKASLEYLRIKSDYRLGVLVKNRLPRTWKGRKLLYTDLIGQVDGTIHFDIKKDYDYKKGEYLKTGKAMLGSHKLPFDKYKDTKFYTFGMGTSVPTFHVREKRWSQSLGYTLDRSTSTVFVYDNGCGNLRNRIFGLHEQGVNKGYVVVVKGCSYRAFLNLVAKLGHHIPHKKLSDIVPRKPVRSPRSYVSPKDGVRNVTYAGTKPNNVFGSRWYHKQATLDFFDTSKKTYYIPTKEYMLFEDFSGKGWKGYSYERLLAAFNALYPGEKLWFVPFTYKTLALKNKSFVNFVSHIDAELKRLSLDNELMDVLYTEDVGSGFDFLFCEKLEKLITRHPCLKGTKYETTVISAAKYKGLIKKHTDNIKTFRHILDITNAALSDYTDFSKRKMLSAGATAVNPQGIMSSIPLLRSSYANLDNLLDSAEDDVVTLMMKYK